MLKRFESRVALRAAFVRGGVLAHREARAFDAIFPGGTLGMGTNNQFERSRAHWHSTTGRHDGKH